MHRTILGLCALVSFGATASADGYSRQYSIKDSPVSIFSWTGAYAGLNAGYSFGGRGEINTSGQAAANVATVAAGARPARTSLDADGFIGGGQIGYNWQMSHWVFGVEADIQGLDNEDSRTVVTNRPVAPFAGVRNNTFTKEFDYLGTLRVRLGYASDHTLVYATGGLAYAGVEASANFFGPQPANVLQFTGETDETEFGYAVGGGVEHALTAHWTAKFEYLYYNLDDSKVAVNVIPGSGGVGTGYDSKFDNDGHILRMGVNYKF